MARHDGMGWLDPMLVAAIVAALAVVGLVVLALLLRRAFTGDVEGTIRARAARRARMRAGGPGDHAPAGEFEAYLVIPDISGYTRFMQLSHFSLAHAQYAVSALLDSIIDAAGGRLAVAKVEGDAVFLYGLAGPGGGRGGLSGAEVGEAVAGVLRAFYRKRAQLQALNTCPCEACGGIGDLEIKTVVHSGRLLLYDLRGHQELSGLPVIVAHRLLKSSLGLARYVLVTEHTATALRLPLGVAPRPHREAYDGVGEVASSVYAFEPADVLPAGELAPAAPLSAKAATAGRKLAENLRALGHPPAAA